MADIRVPAGHRVPKASDHLSSLADAIRSRNARAEREKKEREAFAERVRAYNALKQYAGPGVHIGADPTQSPAPTMIDDSGGSAEPAQAPPPRPTGAASSPASGGARESSTVDDATRAVGLARRMEVADPNLSEDEEAAFEAQKWAKSFGAHEIEQAEAQKREVMQRSLETIQGLQQARQDMWVQGRADLVADRKKLLYGFGDPKEVESAQAVLSSSTASVTQKANAQEVLRRAQEPDPSRIFKGSAGTVRGILGAIGAAIGGIAAGAGGKNTALQTMNDLIDQDIQMQMEGQRQREKDYAGKEKEFFMDIEGMDLKVKDALAVKGHMLEVASSMVESAKARATTGEQIAQLEGLKTGLQEKKKQAYLESMNKRLGAMSQAYITRAQLKQREMQIASKFSVHGNPNEPVDKALQRLRKTFEKVPFHAFVSQFFPWTDASKYDAQRRPLAMMIAAQGIKGAASDRDIERIEATLPKSYTTKWTADQLFNELEAINRDKAGGGSGGGASASVSYSGPSLGEGEPVQ